ncbi:PAP_fibrillin domain-containing protein, partial [Haematococcus lacustris]
MLQPTLFSTSGKERINPDLSSEALGGQWELVYTTEASVHAIVRRLPVAGIQQQVDLE